MSKKSLKILFVLVTIISLISTLSFASDDTPLLTSSDGDTPEVIATEDDTITVDESSDGEDVATTESETADINEDIYKKGTDVTISETVNGNVFIIANTLKVTGQIGGDLFVIADTLDIDGGQIYGNVFAIAKNITLNGLIYDLYAACSTLEVKYDGVSYRDLKVACENATINGVVGKNANLTVSNLLTIKSDAMIYGDLKYTSPNELKLVNSSDEESETDVKIEDLVTGTTKHEPGSVTNAVSSKSGIMDYVITLLVVLVYTLVIWLVISKFTPKFYEKITHVTDKKMLISLLVGFLGLIVIPIIAIVLLLTVVCVPVAIALLVIYGLLISTSFSISAITSAGKLAEKVKVLAKYNNLPAVVISTIVLWVLTLIPVVGVLFVILTVVCGFGLVLMSLYNRKDKKAEVVETKTEA